MLMNCVHFKDFTWCYKCVKKSQTHRKIVFEITTLVDSFHHNQHNGFPNIWWVSLQTLVDKGVHASLPRSAPGGQYQNTYHLGARHLVTPAYFQIKKNNWMIFIQDKNVYICCANKNRGRCERTPLCQSRCVCQNVCCIIISPRFICTIYMERTQKCGTHNHAFITTWNMFIHWFRVRRYKMSFDIGKDYWTFPKLKLSLLLFA